MKIYTAFFSNNTNLKWFKILCFFVLCFLIIHFYYQYRPLNEGFTQSKDFVAKYGEDIYDEFYVNIYDLLNKTNARNGHEYQVFLATQPDKNHTRVLDVGCGTGCLVKKLKAEGYQAIGIDKSKAMTDAAISNIGEEGEQVITCGSTENVDILDPESATHIMCTHFTIYSMEDKTTFFKNCRYWLMDGGYLILHLVDRAKFDLITPAAKQKGIKTAMDGEDSKRKKDTIIEFKDFTYKSTWDLSKMDTKNRVIQIESFQDKKTNKVRQNENILFMEREEDILAKAQECRFSMIAKYSLVDYNEDGHQSIYILQKI